MRKRQKKYEQSISTPYWETTQGSNLADGLRALVARFFGGSNSDEPSTQDLIEYSLTPREREVAYLAALGFSDKEIADALAMNFQTVRVHIRNTLRKLHLDEVEDLRRFFSPRR